MFPIRLLMPVGALVLASLPCTTFGASPLQSSPIPISADGETLLNVNPTSGTVTIFDVSKDRPHKRAEVPVGHEPRSVAINADATLAYAANAADGTVSVIELG